jgi:TM2 domain-containing membrane protein YozV
MVSREKKTDEAYCSSCGQIIKKEAEICPKCGVRQKTSLKHEEKNKLVATLFAILLGGIGIHKFYLGNIPMGILYICFCWTFIPAIVGIIEGIIYLSMTEDEFHKKYG